jgi:hypothetical protein
MQRVFSPKYLPKRTVETVNPLFQTFESQETDQTASAGVTVVQKYPKSTSGIG